MTRPVGRKFRLIFHGTNCTPQISLEVNRDRQFQITPISRTSTNNCSKGHSQGEILKPTVPFISGLEVRKRKRPAVI